MIIENVMESCWTSDAERDKVLYDAIEESLGCFLNCELFIEEASTEQDERLLTAVRVFRRCAEVCHATAKALMLWETRDHGELQDVVGNCILRCRELEFEFLQYPERYSTGDDENLSRAIKHRMRKCNGAVGTCIRACEAFLRDWFEVDLVE